MGFRPEVLLTLLAPDLLNRTQRRLTCPTGGVKDPVDRAEALAGLAYGIMHLYTIGDIGLHDHDLGAVRFERLERTNLVAHRVRVVMGRQPVTPPAPLWER